MLFSPVADTVTLMGAGRYQADTFTSIVVKVRLVNGEGKIAELSGEESISLGALGIASTITLKVIDMYWLEHKASTRVLKIILDTPLTGCMQSVIVSQAT